MSTTLRQCSTCCWWGTPPLKRRDRTHACKAALPEPIVKAARLRGEPLRVYVTRPTDGMKCKCWARTAMTLEGRTARARKAGLACAAKMTPAERTARARKAATARWGKKRRKEAS